MLPEFLFQFSLKNFLVLPLVYLYSPNTITKFQIINAIFRIPFNFVNVTSSIEQKYDFVLLGEHYMTGDRSRDFFEIFG